MDQRTHAEHWNLEEGIVSREVMDRRLSNAVAHRGWRCLMRRLHDQKIPIESLRVAEVGSGSGTFSLTLALMGASVTLIDFNPRALETAGRIYALYGCPVELLQWDCVQPPPEDRLGRYDLACSIGTAEHFTGADRWGFIERHRLLLKEGGVAFISSPNRWSPCYRTVRAFRELTGTWSLDVEVPYTPREFREAARRAGFSWWRIIGNASLWEDARVHSRGLVSAALDCLPGPVSAWARRRRPAAPAPAPARDMRGLCREAAGKSRAEPPPAAFLADRASAGIVLMAVR